MVLETHEPHSHRILINALEKYEWNKTALCSDEFNGSDLKCRHAINYCQDFKSREI